MLKYVLTAALLLVFSTINWAHDVSRPHGGNVGGHGGNANGGSSNGGRCINVACFHLGGPLGSDSDYRRHRYGTATVHHNDVNDSGRGGFGLNLGGIRLQIGR
jgi:hypothetical protein